MMKVGLLTSSRADYGVYLPLIGKMKSDPFFELEIIAFGTHTSKFHGYTLNEIQKDASLKIHAISSLLSNDNEQGIASSYGLTVLKFADFWALHSFDLVLCLGDRFEMSAAVQAGIPFGVKFAHIHGGETTLGAIDNIYRHQITLASVIHFTSADIYSEKIISLAGTDANVTTVGSLSLDELKAFQPIEKGVFYERFNIPEGDFALVTFHPETVNPGGNTHYADEMKKALAVISATITLVISMPNADTLGTEYRKKLEILKSEFPEKVILIENFGKENYFTAMHYAKILIGNSSSGIVEAASFHKYVVNVGDRQKGRLQSDNIINAQFAADDIVSKSLKAIASGDYKGSNIYFKEGAADNIIKALKNY